ncbi:hypothetical protein BRARA_H01996 [Brassica rapa]|uniref:Uncharacterized protein n=1 Tax=Brassica campestris TaxID=3711 RepID=A0A397YCX6_BRACM|nr:hypothetical protein BRARA_H01996 [Brassica rapa]
MTVRRQHIATCCSEKNEDDMWHRSENVTHVTGQKLADGAFNRALHRNTPETGSSRSNRTNNDERQLNAQRKLKN